MPDCSALSPSSTPEASLVLTRYWLLCSSVCSTSISAQSHCQALGLIHPTNELNCTLSTALNWGKVSVVFAASLAILVPFGQNRALTSISASVPHPCYNYVYYICAYNCIIIKVRRYVSKLRELT